MLALASALSDYPIRRGGYADVTIGLAEGLGIVNSKSDWLKQQFDPHLRRTDCEGLQADFFDPSIKLYEYTRLEAALRNQGYDRRQIDHLELFIKY